LEGAQQELLALTQQRRQQLEKLSGLNGEEARAQFLKEVAPAPASPSRSSRSACE
jgi:hypothetical protein